MAHDDRDRTFEKALARHLRSSVSSSVDSNTLGSAPGESCPDPETLAAYHDGLLSSDERNIWKQHVVGCESCQLVLAHLETPLDTSVLPESGENVLLAQPAASPSVSVSHAPRARAKRPPSYRWLWLVPAGAIAASLIAWVSLREQTSRQPLSSAPVEIAENRQAPVVTPSAPASRAVPSQPSAKKKDQSLNPSAGQVPAPPQQDRDSSLKESSNQVQLTQQAPNQYAANSAHGPSVNMQKQQQEVSRLVGGAAGAPVLDQKKLEVLASPKPKQDVPPAAPPPPPPPPPISPSDQPSFVAGGAIQAPLADKTPPAPASAPNVSASKSRAANADAISAATEAVDVISQPRPLQTISSATLQDPHVFGAPGGKQLWRVGQAGSLEYSKDKGVNWIPQVSGVNLDLNAGFAPSAKVCWVVGKSGTILRTTDGGAHWLKLDSPVTADLTGVRAADALHAWIRYVPDQQTGLVKTYQTSDGGATWSPAPGE